MQEPRGYKMDEERRITRDLYYEDKTQTRILKEIVETLKSTSKDEIRENSKAVQDNLSKSTIVGRLGAKGDEFQILKERFQKEELEEEQILRKFNLRRYANMAMGASGALSTGDIGGLAMMGSRGLMGAMSGVGTAIVTGKQIGRAHV